MGTSRPTRPDLPGENEGVPLPIGFDFAGSIPDFRNRGNFSTVRPCSLMIRKPRTTRSRTKAQWIASFVQGLPPEFRSRTPLGCVLASRAINEAGAVTSAGGDYGPQNALRHCIFAGLVTSHGE